MKSHASFDRCACCPVESLSRASEQAGDSAGALQLKINACALSQDSGDPALVESGRSGCIEAAWAQGDLAKADTLLQQSLTAAATKYSNPRSIMWAPLAHNLALVRYARGQRDAALALAGEVEEANERQLGRELATGADAQKRATFETYRTGMNDVLSMGGDGSGGPAAVRLALTTLLRRKGRALDASAQSARAFRYLQTPEQRQLLSRQQPLRGLMPAWCCAATRARRRGGGDAVRSSRSKRKRYKQLVRRASSTSSTQTVTIESVQRHCRRTALVEYVAFIRRDPKNLARPLDKRYYAYLLRGTGEPLAFDLGDALPIAKASDALRVAIRERRDPTAAAHALNQLVLQPLRAQLGANKRLLLSPDDDLNLVPFAALKDPNGKYLLEQYEIDYLTSGRDLLQLAGLQSARGAPVVLGNPDFDAGASAATASPGSTQRSGDLARARFSPCLAPPKRSKPFKSCSPTRACSRAREPASRCCKGCKRRSCSTSPPTASSWTRSAPAPKTHAAWSSTWAKATCPKGPPPPKILSFGRGWH